MNHAVEPDTPPPFDPAAARAAREVMALTPERVAATLASYGVNVLPKHVRSWEDASVAPTEDELVALARTLAVPVAQLMGRSSATLQSFRLRAGLTRAQAGKAVGMSEVTWGRMEQANRWRADERRTQAVVRVLGGLSHRQLIEISGAADELAALLARGVADGRWQAYLSDITEVLGARRRRVAQALEGFGAEFPPAAEKPDDDNPPPLPEGAVDRFWYHLGDPPADPFAPGPWRRPPTRR